MTKGAANAAPTVTIEPPVLVAGGFSLAALSPLSRNDLMALASYRDF